MFDGFLIDFRQIFHNILINVCPSFFAFSVLFSSLHGNMCIYIYIYIKLYIHICMCEHMRAKLSDFCRCQTLVTGLGSFSDLVWICTDCFA